MNAPNHRKLASYCLANLIASQEPIPDDFAHWPPAAKHLLLQSCRYFHRFKALLDYLSTKPAKDPLIIAIACVGLCELFIDHKPAHAVINELVSITKKSKSSFASGYINGVLRQAVRQQEQWQQDLQDDLQYLYSHPLWFIESIQKAWPNDWQQILTENNQHPPMTLRINPNKLQIDDYLTKLPVPAQKTQWSRVGVTLEQATAVNELPGFEQGLVSLQDEAAQLASYYLQLAPKQKVLDACAAPGGKTCHILEAQADIECTAIEPQLMRFEKLKQGLNRLGLNAKCIHADACDTPSFWDGKHFDRILIDAPCSGTGVIRRHPDIKLRRSPEHLLINTPIQEKLLNNLWPLLKPQGILVYATCSILPEENDMQIKKFLSAHSDAALGSFPFIAGSKTAYGQQIFPGSKGMDGFYYAILLKK